MVARDNARTAEPNGGVRRVYGGRGGADIKSGGRMGGGEAGAEWRSKKKVRRRGGVSDGESV